MDAFLDVKVWASLLAIIAMESVLGIDNLVYLALLTDLQPEAHRQLSERIGLGVAAAARLVLLFVVLQLVDLVQPVVTILGDAASWRDITLVAGGVLLLVKGTTEIHGILEGSADAPNEAPPVDGEAPQAIRWLGIAQIVLIDLTFSTDSVATAFALSGNAWVMAVGLVAGMGLLVVAAGPLSAFLNRHPAVRVLAFSYMLTLGMALVADGLTYSIPKVYLCFAIALSAAVVGLDILLHRKGSANRT